MQYFYDFARLPQDNSLLDTINRAAQRLERKLCTLDLAALGVSEYNQRYLGNYIRSLRGILQIHTYILAWSLAGLNKPLAECALVDYGGGPGLLTFLARESGLGCVLYNDIYEVSCADAQKVGAALQAEAQAYVHGDLDQLIAYASQKRISIDVVASYDVIEHIYATERYFRALKHLPHRALKIVFCSSANPHNPLVRRSRVKVQLAVENSTRQAEWGHKQRDSLKSYLELRREIIARHAPALTAPQVDRLAVQTRGLKVEDIQACVDEYLRTGQIGYRPDHPTNTCDPLTGNWSERLMDTRWIARVFQEEGFQVSLRCGYYAFANRRLTRSIKAVLNALLWLSGGKMLLLAPYYMIDATLETPGPSPSSSD